MTYRTRSKLAATLTVPLVVFGTLSAVPAAAQERPGTGAVPPPVDTSVPPVNDTQRPPFRYEKKVACVGSLNKDVVLPNKPWGQQYLRIEETHAFATGKDQIVAVIDTGVRPHQYFGGRVLKGADYVAERSDALEDCDGHGTEVAGIIAARSPDPNQIGFTGVAPDAKILAIRQSSKNYKGTPPATQDNPEPPEKDAGDLNTLAQAVVYAANYPGVTVINMSVDSCRPASIGMTQGERELQRALHYAVVEKDKVVVASAGNQGGGQDCSDPANGSDPKKPKYIITPPWFTDYVLSVAAVNGQGDLAPFSMQGPWVSVAAPGTEIISLDPSGTLANQTIENGQRIFIQGTSFAAPYVAGLAAQIRERFKHLNARQVMDRIKLTAQHPAAPAGRDNLVGHGMINPMAALTAMIPGESGIPADKAVQLPPAMPPYHPKNWQPVTIALIGAGGGVVLLLLTLFVMHAVRRNRPSTEV